MNEPTFRVREPTAEPVPLLLSIPHTGTEVPAEIAARFAAPEVEALPDTDWHLHDLYDFAPALGITTVFARWSRYVVDLNRPRDGRSLYPGRYETAVVPTRTFAGAPIYRPGLEPTAEEIEQRLRSAWDPYHSALRTAVARLRERFGFALVWDAHSITSHVPQFAAEELPGLMLGDVDGSAAAPAITRAVVAVQERSGISFQPNQPFKGGFITRSLGQPAERVHALQLEMSQRLYMDEGPPFRWRADLAEALRPVLRDCLLAMLAAARNL
jgi:N-formylglutamate deformylase